MVPVLNGQRRALVEGRSFDGHGSFVLPSWGRDDLLMCGYDHET